MIPYLLDLSKAFTAASVVDSNSSISSIFNALFNEFFELRKFGRVHYWENGFFRHYALPDFEQLSMKNYHV